MPSFLFPSTLFSFVVLIPSISRHKLDDRSIALLAAHERKDTISYYLAANQHPDYRWIRSEDRLYAGTSSVEEFLIVLCDDAVMRAQVGGKYALERPDI